LVPDVAASLSSALQRVGDRWTLLIVAALLERPLRFGEVQKAVPEIATNVLTSRLRDLAKEGLLVSLPYSERPLRLEYELTSAGAELAGVLKMLAAWGAATERTPVGALSGSMEARDGVESGTGGELPAHVVCGTPLEVRYWCPTCQRVAEDEDESWA
jgi:DNA-binding HxlR family transcriptional regulator